MWGGARFGNEWGTFHFDPCLTMRNYFPLLLLLVGLASCKPAPELKTEPSLMLRKAVEFLWEQQGDDGGWHSQTHGILKSGQTCTAFVMDALLAVPDSIYPVGQSRVEEGLAFIVQHTNAEGALGKSDPDLMEYPNYATAFGCKVLLEHGNPEHKALAGQMLDYLLNQQFDEDREYELSHAVYGGWGFGEEGLTPGNPGHVDLSHTRRILQTLRIGGKLEVECAAKAKIFLLRLQKSNKIQPPEEGLLSQFEAPAFDGGFLYSPVQEDVNKGGWAVDSGRYMQSYATATCDGILAASTLADVEEIKKDAGEWLLKHPDWSAPEGIPIDHFQQWHKVMFYYHLSVRAQAYQALGWEDWQDELMAELTGKQAEDGHFANLDGAANKENDPLIATAMVVKALCAALGV